MSSDTLKSYIKKRKEKIARGKQGIDRATDQAIEKDTIGRTVKKPKGTYDIKKYKGKKGTIEYQKDKDKNQNEAFLADGTTSTEPAGKKINPKNVDNYKSGAVQIAPVDEADPQNGYGVKEGVEVKKKDNRANYAYINFMKNKMRAAFGVKNVMPMVNPDEAEEKFEKLATSMKGTSGDEEEKEGACESVDRQLSSLSKSIMEKQWNVAPAMSYQKYHYGDDITDPNNVPYKDDPKKMKDFFGDKVKPNSKKNRKDIGIQSKTKFDNAQEGVDRQLSDISKTIMERGAGNVGRDAYLKRQANKSSTNIPTESNPGGGVRDKNNPRSYQLVF